MITRHLNTILDALLLLHKDVVELPACGTLMQIRKNSKFFYISKAALERWTDLTSLVSCQNLEAQHSATEREYHLRIC